MRRSSPRSALASEPSVPEAHHRAHVTLPDCSTDSLRIENVDRPAIDIAPRNVFEVVAQSADGYYVYPHAHASGGTLSPRPDDGAEDFVSFGTRPAIPEVVYDLTLGRKSAAAAGRGNAGDS